MKWLNTLGVMYVYIIILYSYGVCVCVRACVHGRMAWNERQGKTEEESTNCLFVWRNGTYLNFSSDLTTDFYTKFVMFHRRIEVIFLLGALVCALIKKQSQQKLNWFNLQCEMESRKLVVSRCSSFAFASAIHVEKHCTKSLLCKSIISSI